LDTEETTTEEKEIHLPHNYAGIFISPDGEVTAYMPNVDEQDGNIYTDSPTWIATVIMTALREPKIREMAEAQLTKDLAGAEENKIII